MTDTVPGPSALVVNAVNAPEVDPTVSEQDATTATGTDSANGTSGRNTPDSSFGATTTVTTVSDPSGHGATSTRTFVHAGTTGELTAKVGKDGSVTLRPIPARGTNATVKTRKARTAFTARTSTFDRTKEDSGSEPFRGFFVLFWLMIAVVFVRTGVRHYSEKGSLWGTSFARLISEDGLNLAVADAIMVSATFLCVPFAKAVKRGWLPYWPIGAVFQHVLQTLFLAATVRWTFHRNWPWVQSGFFTLHTLTMLMKVHSYCSHNGDLSEKARQYERSESKLRTLLSDLGGRKKVEGEARAAWEKAVANEQSKETSAFADSTPDLLAPAPHEGLRRRTSRSRRHSSDPASPSIPSADEAPSEGIEALTWHPDERVSQLAIDLADLDEALVSTGPQKIRYPDNVTLPNFLDYLLIPTLVYHLEYPRTQNIRVWYIAEKSVATFGSFALLILISEHFITPAVIEITESDSFLLSVLDLVVPFMLNYLLIFYLIFECVCNGFAEITRFADREFYQDWWNATSFDEFSRRWNVPVHSFLLRHVYTSTIDNYRFSKFRAAFVTFLLSACVHELVMAVSFKKVRLYLFVFQMAQLPLIMIGRLPVFRRNPTLGNMFFWVGLMCGFPLLGVAYIRF